MTLKRVARDRVLPFDLTPNAETIQTFRKSERGEDVHSFASMDEMFKKLDI